MGRTALVVDSGASQAFPLALCLKSQPDTSLLDLSCVGSSFIFQSLFDLALLSSSL